MIDIITHQIVDAVVGKTHNKNDSYDNGGFGEFSNGSLSMMRNMSGHAFCQSHNDDDVQDG